MAHPFYQVFMQPLTSDGTYGANTDISDKALDTGLGAITRQIDSNKTSVGVFKYSNLNLRCSNKNGFFNDIGTFFTFKRDLAKVQVKFFDKLGVEFDNYRGVVNEAGVQAGRDNDTITFLITARESILNQVQVVDTNILDGDLFSTAIRSILNKSVITSVMDYDPLKINVGLDKAIDVASKLHNLKTKEVLDKLLQASNSIFFIDSTGAMVVSNRDALTTSTTFFGAGDEFGRDNIISLFSYNGGYSRIYNSVTVNEQLAEDATSIASFGLRQLEPITFDFITTSVTELSIAQTIRNEFKDRKKEVKIKVKVEEIRNINILEKVVLDIIDSNYNNIDILTTQTWKIMGLIEYPSNYTADIHLREI